MGGGEEMSSCIWLNMIPVTVFNFPHSTLWYETCKNNDWC